MEKIIIVFLVILLIGLGVACYIITNKINNENNRKREEYYEEINRLKGYIGLLKIELDDKDKEKDNEISSRQAELNRLLESIEDANDKKQRCEEEIERYDDVIKERVEYGNKLIAQCDKELEDKKASMSLLSAACFEVEARKDKIEREINELLDNKKKLGDDISNLNDNISHLNSSLVSLSAQHQIAMREVWGMDGADSEGFRFEKLSPNEEKLIELVDEIKTAYPELSCEFGKIVWSKVWMPKVQRWVKMYGLGEKRNCIYRLSLVENREKCYIGQAVDLKDRWYTHIKKMCGAEPKGGELIYKDGLRPDSFVWEVIEEGLQGGKEEIDKRERYWIEFWTGMNLR